ncbi:hypothetical protein QAD02_018899 [Eretmocerus hayati]|uniref:Uncharacterized protein n=1 Tax=Eretmocerus hayati TaxID=131215 RepID=A0ACC2PIB0_9HYME|nr:hypothetical protein QAD02_018899 [Eretmocerus hayati]
MKPFRYTFSAVLKVRNTFPCSGSIISENHVLTAGSCIENSRYKPMREALQVIVGTTNYNDLGRTGSVIDVEKYFVPLEFYRKSRSEPKGQLRAGDIAILKLKKALNLINNMALSVIDLPREIMSHVDQTAALVGFGWDKIGWNPDPHVVPLGESSGQVRSAEVTILPIDYCQRSQTKTLNPEKHLCGHLNQYRRTDPHSTIPDRPAGACKGDIGGPLVWDQYLSFDQQPWGEPSTPNRASTVSSDRWCLWNSKWLKNLWSTRNTDETKTDLAVVGILSITSSHCDERKNPSVYTNVSFYMDFIQKALKDDFDPHTMFMQEVRSVPESNEINF